MNPIAEMRVQNELLETMIAARQMSVPDAQALRRAEAPAESEEDVLRWLAAEYGLPYSELVDLEPDAQLLAQFPARVLLKYEILPLQRSGEVVQVALSRLFDTEGLDTLRALTGMKFAPVLAPAAAVQREMKKRLGVGADTLDCMAE